MLEPFNTEEAITQELEERYFDLIDVIGNTSASQFLLELIREGDAYKETLKLSQ